jgi:hypothetical protein
MSRRNDPDGLFRATNAASSGARQGGALAIMAPESKTSVAR